MSLIKKISEWTLVTFPVWVPIVGGVLESSRFTSIKDTPYIAQKYNELGREHDVMRDDYSIAISSRFTEVRVQVPGLFAFRQWFDYDNDGLVDQKYCGFIMGGRGAGLPIRQSEPITQEDHDLVQRLVAKVKHQ